MSSLISVKPEPVDVGKLKLGDFFLHSIGGGELRLAVVVKMDGGNGVQWMELNAARAFEFTGVAHAGPQVLQIDIPPSGLRLRIDPGSAMTGGEHIAGQLAMEHGRPLRVNGNWHEHDAKTRQQVRAGVELFGWQYAASHTPERVFGRWSLSYVNEVGQWVDLVKADVKTGE